MCARAPYFPFWRLGSLSIPRGYDSRVIVEAAAACCYSVVGYAWSLKFCRDKSNFSENLQIEASKSLFEDQERPGGRWMAAPQ
jgi:hypothetical protein